MLDKLLSFKMPENITLSISSLTVHNHINIKIEGKAMSKSLQEILAEIATIASAGSVAEVQAQIDSVKNAVAANAEAIAANNADDEATKTLVTETREIVEALVDKLAAAPAPAPTTGGETGGDAGTGDTGSTGGETA